MKFVQQRFGKKKYNLVISGGGVRGFYALGILKALEELDMKKDIEHLYGVSAGAILCAYRSAGYSADWMFKRFSTVTLFGLKTLNLLPKKSLLKNDFVLKMFSEDLPDTFEELEIPITIGTTNCYTGKYLLFKKGQLILPVLGSLSIPGIFPPVPVDNHLLMDGGLINNFPVDHAKKDFPSNRIIGVFLNKFIENQKINNLFDSLSVGYEIMMRANDREKFPLVDDLFYRDLNIAVLSTNKKQMKNIFDIGYKDGLEKFGK